MKAVARNSESKVRSISVIGLGKLSHPLAVCWASRGFDVIAVELNSKILEAVKDGRNPYHAPMVSELLREASSRMKFSNASEYATENADAPCIVVPTPSHPD